MSSQNKGKNVFNLGDSEEPDPQRIKAVRDWHIDQATSDSQPLAVLAFSLTADFQIQSRQVGVDDRIAQAMLPKMREVIDILGGALITVVDQAKVTAIEIVMQEECWHCHKPAPVSEMTEFPFLRGNGVLCANCAHHKPRMSAFKAI